MSNDSFAPFPRLPQELREDIWKLAARSESFGVHFLRLAYHGSDQENQYGVLLSTWPKNYHLLPPRWLVNPFRGLSHKLKSAATAWTNGNPSAYLIDAGLWEACRESRSIVHLGQARSASSSARGTQDLVSLRIPTVELEDSSTPYLENDALSRSRPITMCPKQDLFVFQLDDPILPRRPPLGMTDPAGSFGEWGLEIRHVGWEYHPSWFSRLAELPGTNILNFLCSCAVRGATNGKLEKIWLVNYHIRRKLWVPSRQQAAQPDPKTFKMEQYRFVEVDYEDWHRLPEEESTWEQVCENPGEYIGDVFLPFVSFLQDLIFLLTRHGQGSHPQRTIKVGILACERC